MKKNTTLLVKFFELGKLHWQIFKATAPLFQITAYRADFRKQLNQILNNQNIKHKPYMEEFDKILASNARRSVFVNTKRNDLIQYFNKNGQKSVVYVVFLNQINQFVPTNHLIDQIDSVIKNKSAITSTKDNKRNMENRVKYFRDNVLFPFNLNNWNSALKNAFPKSSQVKSFQLEKSYFSMQISSIYMIQFSRNPRLMYEDLKDFDAFLGKFNFIRFFWQINQNNEFKARKYSERLIKSLKWRCGQTQEYLLMLIRANSWERFILMVQDFCLCYQNLNHDVLFESQINNDNKQQIKQ